MLEKNTVLILGAGASMPFGYPIGTGLKTKILQKINLPVGDLNAIEQEFVTPNVNGHISRSKESICRYLIKNCGFKPEDIFRFYTHFSSSHPSSIDSFLENRIGNNRSATLRLGKALIAMSIYECELQLNLFDDNEDNWYKYLMRTICDSWDDFAKNKLNIITYNYDRSLEYFLVCDLAYTYDKNNFECSEKLKHFSFVHVHGAIAPFPSSANKYNHDYTGENINSAIEGLHLIYEEDEVKKAYIKVHEILNKAEHVFILGFGFDERNLQRLDLLRNAPNARIYATRKGMSNLEIKNINKKLNYKIYFSEFEKHTIVDFFRREVSLKGEPLKGIEQFRINMENHNI